MADKINGVLNTPGDGEGIADLDFLYEDMPGQYIDDVLKSELPGSHLDQLLYGELPGSHLDVILEAPLPGGSMDELLYSPLPGGSSYKVDRIENRRPNQQNRRQNQQNRRANDAEWERRKAQLLERHRELVEEQRKKEFLDSVEKESYAEALAAKNRLSGGPGKVADDIDTLWKTVRRNVQESNSTLSRAMNTSKFVRSQARKEKKTKSTRKMGPVRVFLLMIFFLTFLNRLVIPLVTHFISPRPSTQVDTNDPKEDGFNMSDEEFNSFYNVYNSVIEEKSKFKELFDMTNEEFVSYYEENGFAMEINQDRGIVSGGYSEDTNYVNVYRNKEYLDFSCQNVSHQIDRDVVVRALSGKSTDYVTENLGKTASELGIDWDTIDRFIRAWENDNDVHYSTDDFTIYYYDYDKSGAFYMFGDEQIYISFDKAGQYLEMVAVWQ